MDTAYRRVFAVSKYAEAHLLSYLRRSANRRISTTCLRAAKSTKPTKLPPKKPSKQHLEYKSTARRTPPNPNAHSPPPPNPLKHRTIPIVLGGITLFALSGYTTYLYITLTRPLSSPVPIAAAQQADVSSTYDEIASSFDSHVELTESAMGITSLRRDLAGKAWGDVLEVSVGTGRNLEFYEWAFGNAKVGRVRSFTAVDKSKEMLEIAHEKFSAMFPGILGVRWVVGDASEAGIIPPPPKNANERSGGLDGKKYDTILQTMGLCSVADPVRLLKNLGEHVVEEEGRILLLEHGRGRWEWLNGVLDRGAEEHAKKFGCWWNRDFKDVLGECGLEVVKCERPKWWHGGTTWVIELKKVRGGDEKGKVSEEGGNKSLEKKGWW